MKKIYSLLFFFAGTLSLFAQQPCATMQVFEQHRQDANNAARIDLAQSTARAWLASHNGDLRSTPTITIPVVVHVVYKNATQNITDQQVYSQIAVLNADYRRQNADTVNTPSVFDSIAADVNVEFCLAALDPQGNPTNGITRTSTTGGQVFGYFSPLDDVKSAATGGIDPWPANQYLNIWVCELFPGLLGYAQFPGDAAATDGVVITYTAFGTMGTVAAPSTLGRTATHEIGHWFGLYHIWGDDQDCSGSDSIPDTPNADQASASDCQVTLNSCTNEDPYWGAFDPNDMVQNYMDYSHDSCMNMFTLGQKARMMSFLFTDSLRLALFTSPAGCAAVSTPEFTFDRYFTVYPSPTNGQVMISYFGKWDAAMTVEVIDVTGHLVMTQQVSQYNYSIDLGNLAAGVYTLRFVGDAGVATRKVVRQ